MEKEFTFYFLGIEPIYILGMRNILNTLFKNPNIIHFDSPLKATFIPIEKSYIFISKSNFPSFSEFIKTSEESKIVMMVETDEYHLIENMIKDNVVACLPHSIEITEFEFAIQRISNGHRYYPQDIMELLLSRPAINNKTGISKLLTSKESVIFKFLKEGLRNKEIIAITGLKPSTISTHKKRIFEKFNTKNIAKINERIKAQN